MKKYFLLLLLCSSLKIWAQPPNPSPIYPTAPSAAGNIVKAEYFIDADPGFGNATDIPISAGTNVSLNNITINFAALPASYHYICVRTKDTDGKWSIGAIKGFDNIVNPAYPSAPPALVNIVKMEYFIDNDPGFGNATDIPLTAATDVNLSNITINFAVLTPSYHFIHIRSKDANGKWSFTHLKGFDNLPTTAYPSAPPALVDIVKMEYFFDNDPGFGNATDIPLTAGTDVNLSNITINFAALSATYHYLHVRSKDANGKWSFTNFKGFDNLATTAYPPAPPALVDIVKMEYFIDNDPGFGNGTDIPLTAGTNVNLSYININFAALPASFHYLYVRSKDANGKWSITNIKGFDNFGTTPYPTAPAPAADITRVEYFVDTDPGLGNATPFFVTTASNLTLIDSIVQIPAGLTAGTHKIYIRSKSDNWSQTNVKDLLVYVSPFTVTPSTINFGNVAVGYNKLDSVVIKNVSTVSKTVNSISIPAPFTTSFVGPVTLLPNGEQKIYITFAPTAQLFYSNTMSITTSDGTETVSLQGNGVAPNPAWTLNPTTGLDFGNVQVNTTTFGFFTLFNTGNTPINIAQTNVQGVNANMFIDSIYKTTIPIGGNSLIRIKFTPTSINTFSAKEVVKSSTPGLDSIYSVILGAGYISGPAPVIVYESALPYSGNKGVSPEAGLPGTYTYRIIYKSSSNNPPQAGYPKVGIDRNADQDFIDVDEGAFTMYKDGTSVDYVNGVPYIYSVNHNNVSNTLGYRFMANDANGNAANSINIAYKAGPEITTQMLDLRIFANGITFSNSNPNANQPFTVYAKIENSSPFTANNIPVKYYKDSVLLDSAIVPNVAPYGNTIISKVFSFPIDGFYPIKVWIDSLNTLNDGNVLNNYAIRPVTVGLFSVPGGIITTAQATAQYCPGVVWVRGYAQYYGTAVAVQPMVAGAQVSIIHGLDTFYTTTNSNGYYSYIVNQNLNCPSGAFAYKVSVTDFTLTGNTAVQSIAISCVSCGGSGGGGGGGIGGGGFGGGPCSWVQNTSYNYNFSVTYRSINVANFWNNWDWIGQDTVRLFQDGVKIWEVVTADKSGQVGATFNYSVPYTLNNVGQNIFKVVHKYVYHEYFHLPVGLNDLGTIIPFVNEQTNSVIGVCPKPNLIISSASQYYYNTFNFVDYNQSCFGAGSHTVKLYDSIPNGNYVLIQTYNVASLNYLSGASLSYIFPANSFGWHHLKMITDVDNTVDECFENDNVGLFSMYIPRPELSVSSIEISNHNPTLNQLVNFQAVIQNTSSSASTFKVQFLANGVQIGAKKVVALLNANTYTTVFSDAYTMPTADVGCPINITAVVDIDNEVLEENETNNSKLYVFGSDFKPVHSSYRGSSPGFPFIMYRGINRKIYVPIQNLGTRTVGNVNVKYALAGNTIGNDVVPLSRYNNVDSSGFFYTFNTAGNYVINVTADTSNTVCEIDETNNTQPFYVEVLQGLADFEELSQYISPSNLNPNPGQQITIVGTVKNIGNVPTAANFVRFMVDGVQLGADVPINTLFPGRDTTVACTAPYVSNVVGPVVVKIISDLNNIETEIREDNNEATRAVIYGNAPDFARSQLQGLKFNPNGFVSGDSVTISNYIRNYGGAAGTAWLIFKVKDELGNLVVKDSVQFTIGAIDSALVSKKILMPVTKGTLYSEIVNSIPMEFNFFNNIDSLPFTSTYSLQQPLISNGNIKMRQGNPTLFPGWVGGFIMLGNFDLTINGTIEEFSDANFIVMNGTGRLRIVNTNPVDTFPIGTSINNPNFLVINNTGTPDNFSVNVRDGVKLGGNTGADVLAGNVNKTWNIEEDVIGGSNAILTFNWLQQNEQPNFNRANSSVAHYIGSHWIFSTSSAALFTANGWWKQSQSGITSFSPFTISTPALTALPLNLLNFTAIKNKLVVDVNWATSNEINTNKFEIEHSMDGIVFVKVGDVTAAGNTSIGKDYSFTHLKPYTNGYNYYRLKMIDNNGSFKYSRIATVFIKDEVKQTIIAPNPVVDVLNIVEPSTKFISSVEVYDSKGALVIRKNVNADEQVYSLLVSILAKGNYMLKVNYKTETKTFSFVK